MSIRKEVKSLLLNSYRGEALFYKIRVVREKLGMAFNSDLACISKTYKKRFHKDINLSNPETLCEKIQWLKLFYRDSVIETCSDKYEIRQYLNSLGMGYLGNEVIGVYNSADEINFNSLPDKFVAKATHGSGWNLICTDKSSLNTKHAVKKMNTWLKLDLSVFGREWNYKNIKPRIVIEKFLDYTPLYDYKFMCFNGVPKYIQLNNDFDGKHYVDFYDIDSWTHLPITYMGFECSSRDIEKPKQLAEMIELASKLSKRFPFVRVDFYNFTDTVILGELTFFPSSGLRPILPENYEYDEKFGQLLKLPDPNFNLELLEQIRKQGS